MGRGAARYLLSGSREEAMKAFILAYSDQLIAAFGTAVLMGLTRLCVPARKQQPAHDVDTARLFGRRR
jgi:hypothetical protein